MYEMFCKDSNILPKSAMRWQVGIYSASCRDVLLSIVAKHSGYRQLNAMISDYTAWNVATRRQFGKFATLYKIHIHS